MNKAKTLKMKLIYVVAAVAMLALLIPAMAIPVSAAPAIAMYLVDPVTDIAQTTPDSGYDVTVSTVEITVTGATVTGWNKTDMVTGTNSDWVPSVYPGAVNTVRVKGVWGETQITASYAGGTLTVDKKWGQILNTSVSDPGSSPITWYEGGKYWYATQNITDTLYGDFVNKDNVHTTHPAQGAILNWFLIRGGVPVDLTPGEPADVIARMVYIQAHGGSAGFTQFVDFNTVDQTHKTNTGWLGTNISTLTDGSGMSRVSMSAWGEEAVQILIVPQYPGNPQLDVTPEIANWNVWTREMEVVPQVRWVGEKIVLEKNFTDSYASNDVKFSLEGNSVGALEDIGTQDAGQKISSDSDTVWTTVDPSGMASAILVSQDTGVANVTLALYDDAGRLVNQHGFVVYFLKFESLTLGDVDGKRAGHNSGLWQPSEGLNVWDAFTNPDADMPSQTLNVSQDALERAQVKGYFVNSSTSTRPVGLIDVDQDGAPNDLDDIVLPAGRWVLPDDWGRLAGMNNWQERRIHWDIMDAPDDLVWSASPTGPYLAGQAIPVQGPFSPGIELMTPTGWALGVTSPDPARQMKTVVPNGELNFWDAPMPPAKVIFEIMGGDGTTNTAGYFKDAMKTDIYYLMSPGLVYNAPFYQSLIPAHEAIPAFINNGGYDWNSFNTTYGPYKFWTVINRPGMNAIVPTSDWSGHPTKVEVYTDNHGEAMTWLNGDWNLDLSMWSSNGSPDVEPGATVGTTTVQAMVDYPYLRDSQPIASPTVTKTWQWGKMILGPEPATYPNTNEDPVGTRMVLQTGTLTIVDPQNGELASATSDKKMAWVWVCDRDGKQAGAIGWNIEWIIVASGTTGVHIPPMTSLPGYGISNFNAITMGINVQDGFLDNTSGHVTNTQRTAGASVTRAPTATEKLLFNKYYGNGGLSGWNLSADDFAVAAVEVENPAKTQVDLTIYIHSLREGTQIRHTNMDFNAADRADDPILLGDANFDGKVNMGDVVTIERIILGKAPRTTDADANWDGSIDMGDVVRIERTLLLGQ